MNIVKREPNPVKTEGIANLAKYFDQMAWKGIMQNDNIFEVDQLSLRDALNVYVDEQNALISREPLKKEPLPIPVSLHVTDDYHLIDYYKIGKVMIYVFQEVNTLYYKVIAYDGAAEYVIAPDIQQYHITYIDQYIICFNDGVDGAQVINLLKTIDGWQDFADFVSTPVVNRTTGGQTVTVGDNQFTTAFSEEFIWDNISKPTLPDLRTADLIEVRGLQGMKFEEDIPDTYQNTEFRILHALNFTTQAGDVIDASSNGQVIAVGRASSVFVSIDWGLTFTQYVYPGSFTNWLGICKLDIAGQLVMIVGTSGVHFLRLTSQTWDPPQQVPATYMGLGVQLTTNDVGTHNIAFVVDSNTYCFLMQNTTLAAAAQLRIWGRGKPFYNLSNQIGDDRDTLTRWSVGTAIDQTELFQAYRRDLNRNILLIRANPDESGQIAILGPSLVNPGQSVLYSWNAYGPSGGAPMWQPAYIPRKYVSGSKISNLTVRTSTGQTAGGIRAEGLVSDGTGTWYPFTQEMGSVWNGSNWQWFRDYAEQAQIPFTITGPVPQGTTTNITAFLSGYISGTTIYTPQFTTQLPTTIVRTAPASGAPETFPIAGQTPTRTWSFGNFYYIWIGNRIWTNYFHAGVQAVLTYTTAAGAPFQRVPTASYSDTELYLAFGQQLCITANNRSVDADNIPIIEFVLPVINNHIFVDNINALLNISQTEVALFFEDRIRVCSRVDDEIFGYRYDYYNTKINLGIHYGDEVANTLDGSHTIFATQRGLSIMNYQAYMATTDQTLEFATDNIVEIWKAFYRAGNMKFKQIRNYFYIYNGTEEYLMLDFRKMSWWKFRVPVKVVKMLTDQIVLQVLGAHLYTFDTNYKRYRDIDEKHIPWMLQSQRLHFKLPNHYKNFKQLVFQLKDMSDDPTLRQTLTAQIKLYRKKVLTREPQLVAFKIEEYRTFVKRFNYWKINELQWGIANDPEHAIPSQLSLNGVGVKYERGEEVRS